MDSLEKFDMLPEAVQNIFASNEPRLALERACFLYDILDDHIEKISGDVANVFLKDAPLERFPVMIRLNLGVDDSVAYGIAYEIAKKVFVPLPEFFTDVQALMDKWEGLKAPTMVSEEKAWKRVLDLEPWILEEEREQKAEGSKTQARFLMISIDEILEKYSNVIEQNISSNPIVLQKMPEARPSIKNWINDYEERAGKRKHSPIERGSYLFHSENGKKLSVEDRQKVGIILKSLDEKNPLKIDIEKQIVVFNGADEMSDSDNKSSSSISSIANSVFVNSNFVQRTNASVSFPKQIDNNKKADAEDVFDRFYNKKPISSPSGPVAQGKPPVVLKSISFSPNIAQHAPTNNIVNNANELPQEKIYSIPRSKPPIGTPSYDAASINRNVEPSPSSIVQRPSGINRQATNSLQSKPVAAISNLRSHIVEPKQVESTISNVGNNISSQEVNEKRIEEESFENIQDIDSLSDEMLMKMYQQRKKNVPSGNLNISDTISYTKNSNRNVVDLRNQN